MPNFHRLVKLISLVWNSKDNFQVGTKCVVVADCDLRGEITIGSGTSASWPFFAQSSLISLVSL